MIKPAVRKLMETHLDIARTTISDEAAEVHLNITLGFIEYASAAGDITTAQFTRESQVLKSIRERRRATNIANGAHHVCS